MIAAQPYGLGKILLVGTDGTWRWRHKVGDAYHHRFWGQVVRWSASGKLAAGNALVRFGPLKARLDEGEPARIQARIAEGVPGVGPDLLIAARVTRGGLDAAVVPMRPVPGQHRVFEGIAPNLPIGSYTVKLDVPELVDVLKFGPKPPEAALEIVSRDGPEARRARRRSGPPRSPRRRNRRASLRQLRSRRPSRSARRHDQADHPHRGNPALGHAGCAAFVLRGCHGRVGRAEAGWIAVKSASCDDRGVTTFSTSTRHERHGNRTCLPGRRNG